LRESLAVKKHKKFKVYKADVFIISVALYVAYVGAKGALHWWLTH
jgi:NADH:ubiquinone oxidoreductase subunit 3 (subunit A)